MEKKKFIKYINWGFDDVYLNLLYSYIKGWSDDGKTTHISNKSLSKILCCSESTIERRIKDLVEGGYVERRMTKNNRKRYLTITIKQTGIKPS